MELRVPLVREPNVPRAVPALANPCARSSPRREEHSRRVLPEARAVRQLAHLNNAAAPCLQAPAPALALPAVRACFLRLSRQSFRRRPSLASRFTPANRLNVNDPLPTSASRKESGGYIPPVNPQAWATAARPLPSLLPRSLALR